MRRVVRWVLTCVVKMPNAVGKRTGGNDQNKATSRGLWVGRICVKAEVGQEDRAYRSGVWFCALRIEVPLEVQGERR